MSFFPEAERRIFIYIKRGLTFHSRIRVSGRRHQPSPHRCITKSVSLKGEPVRTMPVPKRSHTALTSNTVVLCVHVYVYIYISCEQTSERGQRYDGRFPVERIKNSVLKPWAGPGTTLCAKDRRGTLQTRGHAQWRAGRVSLGVCPIYTATASTRRTLSVSPSPRAPLERILARTKPTRMHCGTLEPIGPAYDDFIVKKAKALWGGGGGGEERERHWRRKLELSVYPRCLPSERGESSMVSRTMSRFSFSFWNKAIRVDDSGTVMETSFSEITVL